MRPKNNATNQTSHCCGVTFEKICTSGVNFHGSNLENHIRDVRWSIHTFSDGSHMQKLAGKACWALGVSAVEPWSVEDICSQCFRWCLCW